MNQSNGAEMNSDGESTIDRPVYAGLATGMSERLSERRDDSSESDPIDEPGAMTETLLRDAVRARASDIHLEPQGSGMRVRFRIDGVLLDATRLSTEVGGTLQRHLKALGGLDPLPASRPESAGRTLSIGGITLDARTSVAPCIHGEKLAIRLLDMPQEVQHIGRLGLASESETKVRNWLEYVTGTFVVCGPTGSGKTTTLYSLLHELKTASASVVTIEDPVEYRVDGLTQLEVDAMHKMTFAEGLRASLRLDPDYLMLGEIRDEETARVAMSAAGTGRVLMTTLHSKDAVGAIGAMRYWGVENGQLASAMRVVVAQRLVRTLCPACREEVKEPDDAEQRWLETLGRAAPSRIWRAVGCKSCNELGYTGRTGVFEVWRVDNEDAEQILDNLPEQRMREYLRDKGHKFMADDLLAKAEAGYIDLRQIRRVAAG